MFCSHWCLAVTARYGGYDPGYDPGLIWFSTHFSEVAEVFTEICWLPETCTETSDVSIDLTCRTFFVQKVLKYIKKCWNHTRGDCTTGYYRYYEFFIHEQKFELFWTKKWQEMTQVHGRPWVPGGYDDLYDRVPGPGHRDDPGQWTAKSETSSVGSHQYHSVHAEER